MLLGGHVLFTSAKKAYLKEDVFVILFCELNLGQKSHQNES